MDIYDSRHPAASGSFSQHAAARRAESFMRQRSRSTHRSGSARASLLLPLGMVISSGFAFSRKALVQKEGRLVGARVRALPLGPRATSCAARMKPKVVGSSQHVLHVLRTQHTPCGSPLSLAESRQLTQAVARAR